MAISMLNVTMFKLKGGVREGGREQEQEQWSFLGRFLIPSFFVIKWDGVPLQCFWKFIYIVDALRTLIRLTRLQRN